MPDDREALPDAPWEDEPPQWLSTEQTARYLGVTTRTVYRLVDTGELPAYRFGRVIRLRRHEVEEFIDKSRVVPGSLEHLYRNPKTIRKASRNE